MFRLMNHSERRCMVILMQIETNIGRAKSGSQDILDNCKTFQAPADRESTSGYVKWLLECLEESRLHIRTVIETCLSELQRYHIGSSSQEKE